MHKKKCAECGEKFETDTNRIYCRKCRPHAVEFVKKKCKICGKEFITDNPRCSVYCSEAHAAIGTAQAKVRKPKMKFSPTERVNEKGAYYYLDDAGDKIFISPRIIEYLAKKQLTLKMLTGCALYEIQRVTVGMGNVTIMKFHDLLEHFDIEHTFWSE